MSIKAAFEARIQEIKSAIDSSIQNHNGLVGRLAEATHCLEEFIIKEAAGFIESKIEQVAPSIPAADAESVATAVTSVAADVIEAHV